MLLQVDSLQQLNNNPGFWDNYVWPLAVSITIALLTGLGWLFKDFLFKRNKPKPKVLLSLGIDSEENISITDKKSLESKLLLIRQLIRNSAKHQVLIELKPLFTLSSLDKYRREELNLRLKDKADAVLNKLEIMFIRPIEIGLETSPNKIRISFENLIKPSPFIVTGLVKLDIYQPHNPKIHFPIYITEEEFEEIAFKKNKTVSEMKNELSIPMMHTMTILNDDIFYRLVIPELIATIRREQTRSNFSINTPGWEHIRLYEIGLG